MSCLICCFKTLSFCGLRDAIINCMAFNPPKSNVYQIQSVEQNDVQKPPIYKLVLPEHSGLRAGSISVPDIECTAHWIFTKTNSKIPALYFHNKTNTSNFVLLYSHGNAADLGIMRPYLMELSYLLNINVFAYEYNGYGPTKGSPNDMEVVFDAMAAYEELTQRMGYRWNQIILYGRSIGSGPSLYLASHPNFPVAGVILHSPIASGLRMFDLNMKRTHKKDLYPNVDMIEHVKAPVFIMHGESDQDVPIAHGKLLATKCKNLYHPWWAIDGDHNNLDVKFRRTYFMKLTRFVKHTKEIVMRKSSKQLEEMYRVKPWHEKSDHVYFKKEKLIEEKWKKTHREYKKPPQDYYALGSNSSFLTNQNLTSQNLTAYTHKNSYTGESLFTTMGDQTVRKMAQDTARSAYESEMGNLGKESNDMTAIKLTMGDRSSIKEQSMEIEMSARNKPNNNILKATVLETFETPRIIDDEKEMTLQPQQKPCKGDYPSPYELSFDNSNFVIEVEVQKSNMASPSKQDIDMNTNNNGNIIIRQE